MSQNNLETIPNVDLIKEIHKRGLLTNAKTNRIIIDNLNTKTDVKVILTFGLPKECMECRECGECKDSKHFSFYLGRVDRSGYLMRSNALCDACTHQSNTDRNKVLSDADIPDAPEKGSTCENCNRKWLGNWHRHHVGDKFISWICGHCNMSFSDQRNRKVKKI